jgi:hypothetical protein
MAPANNLNLNAVEPILLSPLMRRGRPDVSLEALASATSPRARHDGSATAISVTGRHLPKSVNLIFSDCSFLAQIFYFYHNAVRGAQAKNQASTNVLSL